MTAIRASAPGKLVLSGEYAVLDGAPAICMAVDRRAQVTIGSSEGDHHIVMAPGFSAVPGSFASDSGELAWIEDGEDYALFEHVWSAARVAPRESLAITLDTRQLHDADSGVKLGIGSSAALTAALAIALAALGGRDARDVAREAHHASQRGAGSGVDIACSFAGGIIEYHMRDSRVGRLDWPAGLHYAALWSGVAADTKSKLERLQSFPDEGSRQDLGKAATRCAATFAEGNATEVVAGLGRYCQALRRFDTDHRLGIFGAGHASLVDLAGSRGVAYKPCGAGGGDIGIVLATREESLASFVDDAVRSGYRRLDIGADPQGALLDEKDRT